MTVVILWQGRRDHDYAGCVKRSEPVNIGELPNATRGRTIATIGIVVGLLSLVATFTLLPSASTDRAEAQLLSLGLLATYWLSCLILMIGALNARKALRLNAFAIVLGCLLAALFQLLWIVLIVSIAIRFSGYFAEVKTAQLQPPSGVEYARPGVAVNAPLPTDPPAEEPA